MPKTRKTPSPAVSKPAIGSQPTREAIALRAYELYQERGGAPGHELEDWTRAERELSQKKRKPRRRSVPKAMAA